jgi:hypothetical protein
MTAYLRLRWRLQKTTTLTPSTTQMKLMGSVCEEFDCNCVDIVAADVGTSMKPMDLFFFLSLRTKKYFLVDRRSGFHLCHV